MQNPEVVVYHLFFTESSSVEQRPSSPEKEEDSPAPETERGRVIDMITTASPSRDTVDDLVSLEVTTENLSDLTIPEVQDTKSELSSPSNTTEEEMSAAAAPHS